MELLRRQYLQLLDPDQLVLPKPEPLRDPQVQQDIYEALFNDAHVQYLAPARYRYRVLKRIVRAMEDAILDPDEDVCPPAVCLICRAA